MNSAVKTEAKHTPGPWDMERPLDAGDFAAIVAYAEGQPVVIAELGGAPPYSRDEGLANARLIAAAPDMYKALTEARAALVVALQSAIDPTLYESDTEWLAAIHNHVTVKRINAAIAKAEDGQ